MLKQLKIITICVFVCLSCFMLTKSAFAYEIEAVKAYNEGIELNYQERYDEAISAFEEAVDDYIAACKKTGKSPQKPYSGHIMLRVPPELHAKAALLAEAQGQSSNSWVTELLDQAS